VSKDRSLAQPPQHYVVFDTETTGLPRSSAGCPVRGIQFGLALSDGRRVVERFRVLVRPSVWAPSAPDAERIHGLSRAHVEARGVEAAAAWEGIDGILAVWAAVASVPHGSLPLLAWNAPFDTEILFRLGVDAGAMAGKTRLKLPDVALPSIRHATTAPHGCLMRGYKAWAGMVGLAPGGSLDKARSCCGLPARTGHHDAADDAALAADVLHVMLGEG